MRKQLHDRQRDTSECEADYCYLSFLTLTLIVRYSEFRKVAKYPRVKKLRKRHKESEARLGTRHFTRDRCRFSRDFDTQVS